MNNYIDKPKIVKKKKSFEAKKRSDEFEIKMFLLLFFGIIIGITGLFLEITFLIIVGGCLNIFSGLSVITTGWSILSDEIEEAIDNIGRE